jgi:hypothetical protein
MQKQALHQHLLHTCQQTTHQPSPVASANHTLSSMYPRRMGVQGTPDCTDERERRLQQRGAKKTDSNSIDRQTQVSGCESNVEVCKGVVGVMLRQAYTSSSLSSISLSCIALSVHCHVEDKREHGQTVAILICTHPNSIRVPNSHLPCSTKPTATHSHHAWQQNALYQSALIKYKHRAVYAVIAVVLIVAYTVVDCGVQAVRCCVIAAQSTSSTRRYDATLYHPQSDPKSYHLLHHW